MPICVGSLQNKLEHAQLQSTKNKNNRWRVKSSEGQDQSSFLLLLCLQKHKNTPRQQQQQQHVHMPPVFCRLPFVLHVNMGVDGPFLHIPHLQNGGPCVVFGSAYILYCNINIRQPGTYPYQSLYITHTRTHTTARCHIAGGTEHHQQQQLP